MVVYLILMKGLTILFAYWCTPCVTFGPTSTADVPRDCDTSVLAEHFNA